MRIPWKFCVVIVVVIQDGGDRLCQESDSAFVVGRRGSVDVNSGKAALNSTRTSSSTILCTVHASGAFLPSNSPGVRGDVKDAKCIGDGDDRLRPHHLKYSSSSGSGSFDTLLGETVSLAD